jgi:aspartate carbamoyltransferase catalytic subunit
MKNRSLVSIDDFTREEIINILDMAEGFEKQPVRKLLEGKVIATLFFEPSTRTRLSFSSVAKGETLHDTIKMVSGYSDLIVMRHPIEGSARFASEVASVPVINAGDGANQHPTQTLLDLYSIRKTQGTLDNLNIFMVGDLKYGRTVHSLMMAMSRWNATFNFISPDELRMPNEFKMYLDNLGLKYYEHSDFTDIISKADIIYMTRVQKERFSDPIEYEKVKNVYVLRNSMLANTKHNMRILHPLPRVNEIATDVDANPKAYYFEQAENGVYTRQAILCTLLGIN